MGDLIATCQSSLSRNHRLGVELARGGHPGPIDGAIGGVAEGAFTVEAARVLADQLDVDAPIVREVHLALYERKPVRRCLADLLAREARDEQADAGAWRTALSGR